MPTTVEQILEEFDRLAEEEKRELVSGILRRIRDNNLPPLSEAELILNAESVFLELDERERENGAGTTRGDLVG